MCWKYSWKTFCASLFTSSVAYLIISVGSRKKNAPSLMPISVDGTGNNQLESGQESMSYAPVVSRCSLIRDQNRPICWSIVHFSGRFVLTVSLRNWKISMYTSLFTVSIPVNYTSEFREHFEVTTNLEYFLKISREKM